MEQVLIGLPQYSLRQRVTRDQAVVQLHSIITTQHNGVPLLDRSTAFVVGQLAGSVITSSHDGSPAPFTFSVTAYFSSRGRRRASISVQ